MMPMVYMASALVVEEGVMLRMGNFSCKMLCSLFRFPAGSQERNNHD